VGGTRHADRDGAPPVPRQRVRATLPTP
jgi:hypothetical protein